MDDSRAAPAGATTLPGDGDTPLPRLAANHAPLTPLSFLARAAEVYPERLAIVHGERRLSWGEVGERCRRLAARLADAGVVPGDVVAVIAPNVPALYEAHFAVPLAGAILNAINTRLEPATVGYILAHGGAKVVLVDRDSTETVRRALEGVDTAPLLVSIDDPEATGEPISDVDYERFLAGGDANRALPPVEDEWQSIALNYTSGTTGNPKGVLYHHRGAYLNALANISGWHMGPHPVYLWTLPMFHCNGWCFPWTLAANAGVSVCTRRVDAGVIYEAIAERGVTHLCGAPIVMSMIVNAPSDVARPLPRQVEMMTAAAPPPASTLARIESLGFRITHVYGLTEVYGPAVICAWKPEWDALEPDERARLKARQGVRYQVLEGLDVLDPETMRPVARDGETIGEIMFRGNIVMRGYHRDPEATAKAFAGGWFHSGDLAVIDPDGYLRILDRAKDIIISGGENVSSIEVENALHAHPAVLDVAVAARPDATWGESPCAFVELAPDAAGDIDEAALIAWCRERLAGFKCPRTVVFRELPKTSTGKVQKFALREWAKALGERA